jgi:hypothetical protein
MSNESPAPHVKHDSVSDILGYLLDKVALLIDYVASQNTTQATEEPAPSETS